MNRKKVEAIFERLKAANPHPRTELKYSNPYELLVAVILSAQSTDKMVNQVTRELFQVANTPKAMLELGEEGLKRYIRRIGLYNTKARHIIEASRILVERYGGQVPRERKALESLPGVGRKTANVVLNTAFGEPTIAVDTHIFRVARRIGLVSGKTPRQVEEELMRIVPEPYKKDAHHWLILLGRYICTARKPRCWECPIRDLCEYPRKTPPPEGETHAHRSP